MSYQASRTIVLKAIAAAFADISRPLAGLSLLLMVVSLFLVFYVGIYAALGVAIGNTDYFVTSGTIATALALFMVGFLLMFFFLNVELRLKDLVYSRRPFKSSEALLAAIVTYPQFLVSTVLEAFVIIGGLFLLIVPGLYFGARTMFFNISNAQERLNLASSLRRSMDVGKQHIWLCLELILIYIIAYGVTAYLLFNFGLGLGTLAIYLIMITVLSLLSSTYTLAAYNLFSFFKNQGERQTGSILYRKVLGAENRGKYVQ